MNGQGKDIVQRLLAIIVIVSLLALLGIPPPVIFFFAIVTYFIWRAVQRTEEQDTRRVFEFYIAASDILRDEERRWFGFEIAEVLRLGTSILHSMPDPPPLVYFALGALHHRAGNHESAVEYLTYLKENERGDECRRVDASPELRRYVQVLRRLEREPAEAPQTMTAIRHLDRARRNRLDEMLIDSQQQLATIAANQPVAEIESNVSQESSSITQFRPPANIPPPISEVLRDLYEEEKKTA
jgi:hypothetical protein